MATRVTMPPLDHQPMPRSSASPPTAQHLPADGPIEIPVAKVQLLNDRGDRQAEAAWLDAAARPGVVTLLSTSTDPFTIVTAHAGSSTMRTARLSPTDGLDTMLQTAEILAALHRDQFVHGKLSVDHIIIGMGGPVLCSPDGTATDPSLDVVGLARCMRELARQWDEAGTSAAWRPDWDSLAERLEAGTDQASSAARIVHALTEMKDAVPAPVTTRQTAGIPRGLAIAAAITLMAIIGLFFAPSTRQTNPAAPLVVIDGSTYAIGSQDDDVIHLDQPCDPDGPVVTLRPSTGEVWVFTEVGDGVRSLPIAIVPGATQLRAERHGDQACDLAVARGPAGSTVIDTARLLAGRGLTATDEP